MRTLSIIIPAYNEERTIHLILDKVRNVELMNGVAKDVVIVNDGSTDGTVTAVERYITVHPGMGMDAHPQTESLPAPQHGLGVRLVDPPPFHARY